MRRRSQGFGFLGVLCFPGKIKDQPRTWRGQERMVSSEVFVPGGERERSDQKVLSTGGVCAHCGEVAGGPAVEPGPVLCVGWQVSDPPGSVREGGCLKREHQQLGQSLMSTTGDNAPSRKLPPGGRRARTCPCRSVSTGWCKPRGPAHAASPTWRIPRGSSWTFFR